jgi:xanthine dehydrogenase accessory factor
VFERVAELERARTPFALATVVARQPPISAHVGDRAIVLADGRMQGFVGGSCARDIVRRQAVSAMRSGTARLVQIRPNAPPDVDDSSPVGTVVVPMACASEGAVDVYVEPHLPPRILLVAGATPVAHALAHLGALLDGYRMVHFGEVDELPALRGFLAGLDPNERAGLAAVVATQGHYDEPVLEALLADELPPYVGLLASRRRAADVFDIVVRHGITRDRVERVRNPAGIDIGARRPSDVAISILAEIVATASANEPQALRPESLAHELKADPVCGMDVEIARTVDHIEHDGQTYYFCCAPCRETFAAAPQRYAVPAHA